MKIKTAKIGFAVAVGALLTFFFVRYFVSQLGRNGEQELAGVLLTAPPDYMVVERGELRQEEAASELERVMASSPGERKIGIRFEDSGAKIYLLLDRERGEIERRFAGASGTRVQTLWQGHVQERIQWAKTHGDFSVPGLPAPEQKNLYH